jgi:hypothetical protein
VAWGSPEVSLTEAPGPHLRQLLAAPDGSELVLFHASEQRGVVGACGCSVEPLGGLARVDRYITQTVSRSFGSHVVRLHLGHAYAHDRDWSAGRMTPEAQWKNQGMTTALGLGGWDVLNLACDDAWAVLEEGVPAGLLSTNLSVPGLEIPSYWMTQAAGLDVAVLGVSGPCKGGAPPLGTQVGDPIEAVKSVLSSVDADLVVVVAYGLDDSMMAFAQVPEVDLVIEAGDYQARYRPQVAGDLVWVRSSAQTTRLGELRLDLHEGVVRAVEDRRVRLGREIRGTKALEKLEGELAVWPDAG